MWGLFQSFLPLQNPIGFGASDFIEFEIAALLVLLIFAHSGLKDRARRLAAHTGWSMLVLALLPVALRLAMLAQSPVPTPGGSDDFAYLLSADTLQHFRLANPPHAMHQFFETIFVLQKPTYSSIFPIGQGLVLALGWVIFGTPWAGVVLSVAALCALCYWMLRAWTTPGWALVGGVLAAIEFGPLRYWMNTYWGGAVSAAAGCLVFGSLPRLRDSRRVRDAVWLGLGIGLEILTRPFESVLVLGAVLLFFAPAVRGVEEWRRIARLVGVTALAGAPALGLTLLQNRAVTGQWTTFPYVLSRHQYGVPATFTTQPNPVPHQALSASQKLDYEAQAAVHGPRTDTLAAYWKRAAGRVRFYRFFFLPALYLVLPFFLPSLRQWRFAWVAATLLILALGTNFYPYFYPHYIAAATCLFVLVSVAGLERLSRIRVRGLGAGQEAATLVVLLCAAQFLFWYGFHLFADRNASLTMLSYESWDYVNHDDPQGRIAVRDELARSAGRQLVFVRYWPQHLFGEWIHNAADIDGARVVWALDRGDAANEALLHYYPHRTVWLLEPDARPPRLSPYHPETVTPATPRKPAEERGIPVLPVP